MRTFKKSSTKNSGADGKIEKNLSLKNQKMPRRQKRSRKKPVYIGEVSILAGVLICATDIALYFTRRPKK